VSVKDGSRPVMTADDCNHQHMYEFMDVVLPYIPDDIQTIHEYGCRTGAGTKLLRRMGYDAKGYDRDIQMWTEAIYANIEEPVEDADMIVALQVFESCQVGDIQGTIDKLLGMCKYLGISVHTKVSRINPEMFGDHLLLHRQVEFPCYIDKHDFYLVKGTYED